MINFKENLTAYIAARIQTAASLKSLAADVSERFGLSRNKAYQLVLEHKAAE